MDFNEIWFFIKVVEAGGFSKASRLLGIPKSTVSAKVAKLEKRLGLTLIRRTTRQIRTTDVGREYYEACAKAFTELEDAEKRSIGDETEAKGSLRVTAPIQLGNALLPELIGKFMRAHPGIRVELTLSDNLIDLVQEGVDVAIRVGELPDSSLISRRIGSTAFHLVANPAYLKARGTPEKPKDLEGHACLLFNVFGQGSFWELMNGSRRQRVPVRAAFSSNNLLALKRLACLGFGVAPLPRFMCDAEIANGALTQVLPKWGARIEPIYAVFPNQRFVPPKVRRFVDLISSETRLNER